MKLRGEKIKKGVINILKKFSQNLWLFLVFLLILDLLFGGIFFWKYYLQAKAREVQRAAYLRINQALMERFSEEWAQRERIFQQAETKEYPNLF